MHLPSMPTPRLPGSSREPLRTASCVGTRSTPVRRAAALAALVIATTSCANDDAPLEEDLADLRIEVQREAQTREEATAALRERIDELESAIASATDDGALTARLEEVDERLAGMVDDLTLLETDLQSSIAAREELSTASEAADRDLRGALAELRGELDTVRGSVAVLTDQVEVLRERVDRASG